MLLLDESDPRVQAALDAYHALCRAEGGDGHAELAEIRLSTGHPPAVWIAARLAAAARNERVDRNEHDSLILAGRYMRCRAPFHAWVLAATDPQLAGNPNWQLPFSFVPVDLLPFFLPAIKRSDRLNVAEYGDDPAVLAAFVHDPDTQVRHSAATNTRTPPDALRQLAHDSDSWVVQGACANPATPVDALLDRAQYVGASWYDVVLRNPSLPTRARIGDGRIDVLVVCPDTSAEVLADWDGCRPYWRVYLNELTAQGRSELIGYLAYVAANPHPEIRVVVAAHPNVRPTTQGILAHDPDPRVRAALAANPRITASARERLATFTPETGS